jgi:hypothetical protein
MTNKTSNMNTPSKNTQRWERADYYADRKAVAALFHNPADGERAINALKAAGFKGDQIGVAMRDRNAQGYLIEEHGTKATEGAVSGAVGGGLLGGLAGFLVGIGALAIPGIGPVVSAGILSTALATAATGAGVGAVVGGVAGALVGLGIPDHEAKYFDEGFRKGGMLVTVNAPKRTAEAAEILERSGADLGASSMSTNTKTANKQMRG